MSDRLDQMFELQNRFNDLVRTKRKLDMDAATWLQKDALALMVELGEVVTEAGYKWWKNSGPIEIEKLHEELVDVFHFF